VLASGANLSGGVLMATMSEIGKRLIRGSVYRSDRGISKCCALLHFGRILW
jgi:hypothetical protein